MKQTKAATKNRMKSDAVDISDHDFLAKLIIGIGEVAAITGIPQRQLRYWQEKGIIHASMEDTAYSSTRCFDYLQIKKILLIKELLDEGFTLDAAAQKVDKRMEMINSAFKKFKNNKR
jgi:MerR family transcriptional regulator, global nitrogen regulator